VPVLLEMRGDQLGAAALQPQARARLEREVRVRVDQPGRRERTWELLRILEWAADEPPVRDPQVDPAVPVGQRDGPDVEALNDGSGACG
jgi:hypothetical protein